MAVEGGGVTTATRTLLKICPELLFRRFPLLLPSDGVPEGALGIVGNFQHLPTKSTKNRLERQIASA